MKVSIFSQRNINGYENNIKDLLSNWIDEQGFSSLVFLTGGAQGAQSLVHESFKELFDFVVFRPWTQISRRLELLATKDGKFDPVWFFFRNIQIVDNSDVVIIFDTGDKDAEVYKVRELCQRKGKTLVEFRLSEQD